MVRSLLFKTSSAVDGRAYVVDRDTVLNSINVIVNQVQLSRDPNDTYLSLNTPVEDSVTENYLTGTFFTYTPIGIQLRKGETVYYSTNNACTFQLLFDDIEVGSAG